jgi:ComF family protein
MNALAWPKGATSLAERIFGGTCYLCRGQSRGVLCVPCNADLPYLPEARCPRCAIPTREGAVCGRCTAERPAFDATVAVFSYAFPADVLVQGLKFRSELALAPFLGGALHSQVRGGAAMRVDLVVPVPLHDLRLRERGYNQSMEIARSIAAKVGAPLHSDVCTRVRNTPAQLGLPLKERRENVRDAFSCRRPLDGASVAVVDDVMTTGATLDEMAATLKKFGATRVVNWVVARTPDR